MTVGYPGRACPLRYLILRAERAVTADTALRLAFFFDMPPDFCLGLQIAYVLGTTLANRLDQEVTPHAA